MNRLMRSVSWLSLVVVLGAATARAYDAPSKSPLTVRIVPHKTPEKGPAVITLFGPPSHFWVVVTNSSDKPVRLWREWCSWGWYSLSFRVTDSAGKVVEVKKGPRGWRKNYPDATVLQPGEHLVFEVAFDEETWPSAPVPEQGKFHDVRMKAVFAVPVDDESKKQEVWTGEVSSPEGVFTIYR